MISGSFAKRDVQLEAFYASLPPCTSIIYHNIYIYIYVAIAVIQYTYVAIAVIQYIYVAIAVIQYIYIIYHKAH